MNTPLTEDELVQRLATDEPAGSAADPDVAAIQGQLDEIARTLRTPHPSDPFVAEPELAQTLAVAADLTQISSAAGAENDRTEPEVFRSHPRQLGQYRLLEPLGSGGMGTVYRAMHTKLGRVVAVKVLPAERFPSEEIVARFEREMRAAGLLQHPHIVAAHDAAEVDGHHYLVMELVDGVDVSQLQKRLGVLPIAEACEIVRQAALGLQHIHEHGLVHRDIKPSNLMLVKPQGDRPSIVKILDLGLALLEPIHLESERELTTTGQVMGTIDYMAPEQGLDTHRVDIRADVYSLGATLYKLLSGRAPLEDSRFNTIMRRLVALDREDPPELESLRPECPPELTALVARLLSKSPVERPAQPQEVARLLEPFAQGADLTGLLETALGTKFERPQGFAAPSLTLGARPVTPSETPSSMVPAVAQGVQDGAPPRRTSVVLGAAGGFLAVVLAVVVFFFQTADGVVRVEISDPSIKVEVQNNELQFVGVDRDPIRLKPGKHALRVTRGDFEFETDKLTLNKGDQIALKVELVQGQLQIVQAGRGVIDSRPLPAVVSSQPVKPVMPPATIPAPVVTPKKPYSLIRGEQMVRAFKTLTGALAETQPGDHIEIHGFGPHVWDFTGRFPKDVLLRAATGPRPRLVIPKAITVEKSAEFTGLDLQIGYGYLWVEGDTFVFDNCRVAAGNIPFSSASFRAVNSALVLGGHIGYAATGTPRFTLENCVVHAANGVFNPGGASAATVELKNNTIYQEVADGGGLINNQISLETELKIAAQGNIFHYRGQRGFFDHPEWQQRMGKTIHWSGENNLYSGTLFWVKRDNNQGGPAQLADWNQLIGHEEAGSRFVDQVDLALFRTMEGTIQELAPSADAVLDRACQSFGLTDFGPVLSEIGAGAPYTAWLTRQNGAAIEERAEVLPGGPFVVIRQGREPMAFSTLQEALNQAADGDTIEIRKDGDAGSGIFDSAESRGLILRGGAGYRPEVNGLRLAGKDRLSFENLIFTDSVVDSSWKEDLKAFAGGGGVRRITHCEFRPLSMLMANLIMDAGQQPVIESSRLMPVHYGVNKEVQLEIRNCVLNFLRNGRDVPSLGQIAIDRCLFWNPEPRFSWRPISAAVAFEIPLDEKITLTRSYASGAAALVRVSGKIPEVRFANWNGQGNVYAVPNYVYGTPNIDWASHVGKEVANHEDLPLLTHPRLWTRLNTEGDPTPDGQPVSYGADVTRIAVEKAAP